MYLAKSPEFRRFSSLARLLQRIWQPQDELGKTDKHTNGDFKMTATDFSNRFAAAAFSLVVSATLFAYAIVPASPTLA